MSYGHLKFNLQTSLPVQSGRVPRLFLPWPFFTAPQAVIFKIVGFIQRCGNGTENEVLSKAINQTCFPSSQFSQSAKETLAQTLKPCCFSLTETRILWELWVELLNRRKIWTGLCSFLSITKRWINSTKTEKKFGTRVWCHMGLAFYSSTKLIGWLLR